MDSGTRAFVRARAQGRCEYCRLPEMRARLPHQLEHIIAKQHRGTDDPENLALACAGCNSFKGPNVAGIDPATGAPVDLWAVDGRVVDGPVADPIELTGVVLPGFVDAHCHVGYSTTGKADLDEAEQQARTNLQAGALAGGQGGRPPQPLRQPVQVLRLCIDPAPERRA